MSPSPRSAAARSPRTDAPPGQVHGEPSLPAGNGSAQRWVWHSRFGANLIEVIGEQIYVNGQQVVRHAP